MEDRSTRFGPGFLATFLYYFSTTALLTTFIISKGLDLNVGTGLPQQIGVVIGLLVGLLGGYFNRTTSFSVAFTNRDKFVKSLDSTLSEMGYEVVDSPDDVDDDIIVYRRSALGRFLSGKVFVQLEPHEATIASRSVQVNGIRNRVA